MAIHASISKRAVARVVKNIEKANHALAYSVVDIAMTKAKKQGEIEAKVLSARANLDEAMELLSEAVES